MHNTISCFSLDFEKRHAFVKCTLRQRVSEAAEFEECFLLFHCAFVISIGNSCVEWCPAKGFNWTEGHLKAQHAGRCSIQVKVFIVVATRPLSIKLHGLYFLLIY